MFAYVLSEINHWRFMLRAQFEFTQNYINERAPRNSELRMCPIEYLKLVIQREMNFTPF